MPRGARSQGASEAQGGSRVSAREPPLNLCLEWNVWCSGLGILTLLGRRIRQRRDATGAPTQRPEWPGGVSRPREKSRRGDWHINSILMSIRLYPVRRISREPVRKRATAILRSQSEFAG